MTFNDNQPIYVQIAGRLADEIAAGIYAPEERVPGVRDYSAKLEVNVNTTVKAFDLLARRGVLYTRRGLGYFVSAEAVDTIRRERKAEFYRDTLPAVFARMRQLGIGEDEMVKAFRTYCVTNEK